MELRDENQVETISGIYLKTLMRDYQSGYTVFKINTGVEVITCVGHIILPIDGMTVEVTGTWKDGKYGKQLTDCSLVEVYTDKKAMLHYLQAIPNIGSKTAEELIDVFGERIYEIAVGPDAVRKLKAVPSMTEKRAEAIVSYIKNTAEQRKLFELVVKHGGSYSASTKIYKEYGGCSVAKFTENPYVVGAKAGLSFAVCDSVAKANNITPYCQIRILGAITQILKKEANAGHTYLTYPELIRQARKMLGVTEYDVALATACINACLTIPNGTLHAEDDAVYLSYLYYEEVRTAFAIKRLVRDAIPFEYDVEKLIAYAEEVCGVKYADQQREAFELLLKGGLGIITGGPGTGKTTVIRGLLAAYQMVFPDKIIKLCAPTGRASQRMKEATGREATTIHRILEYKPFGDTITCKNEADPIEADFIFIDEASMISIDIADMLFSAIKSGTMVIIAGDTNQLPAVGAGNVLRDMLDSGIVPKVELVKTYRQAGDSPIIENATRIKQGITKLVTADDFVVIEADDSDIPEITKSEFLKYNSKEDVFAVQVLTPARQKRLTASNMLNKTLQSAVNNNNDNMLRYGETTYRIGDKVMFMRNNYTDGYFNGDVGIVKSIYNGEMTISLDCGEITITEDLLEDLSLAYATTIHKSQGSEYNTAIVVLPTEPATMLQNNLLYTAITRAKKRVVLIAGEGTIGKAITKKTASKRKSKLIERLRS